MITPSNTLLLQGIFLLALYRGYASVAWSDYIYWQGQDKKTLKRLNALIKDAMRNPEDGIGKPEEFRESLSGFWSRRIDDVHRLVYAIEKDQLIIITIRYHY